jgi:hypothetical protein
MDQAAATRVLVDKVLALLHFLTGLAGRSRWAFVR